MPNTPTQNCSVFVQEHPIFRSMNNVHFFKIKLASTRHLNWEWKTKVRDSWKMFFIPMPSSNLLPSSNNRILSEVFELV